MAVFSIPPKSREKLEQLRNGPIETSSISGSLYFLRRRGLAETRGFIPGRRAQRWFITAAGIAALEKQIGSGSRPSPTPIPIPEPALEPAGAASPQETSDA